MTDVHTTHFGWPWCFLCPDSAARAALCICLGLASIASVDAATLPVLRFDRAASSLQQPQAPIAAPQDTVRLPDDWEESRPGFSGTVWYRSVFKLGAAAPDVPAALYIARGCSRIELRLNLSLVESDNYGDEATPPACSRPRLLTLPPALLRAGDNVLDIGVSGAALDRVASVQAAAGLSRFEFGPEPELAATHFFELVLAPVLAEAARIVLVGLGFVLVTMGWLSRRESHFAYLGCLCLVWVAVSFGLWDRDLSWSEGTNEFVLACSWSVLLALAVQASLRLIHFRSKRVERLLCLQIAVMPVTLWLGGPERLFAIARVWYGLFALELCWAQWVLLATTARERPRAFKPLMAIAGGIGACVLVELGAQFQFFDPTGTVATQLVAPLLVFALGVRLIRKFNRSLRTIEADRNYLVLQLQGLAVDVESRVERLAQERSQLLRETERKRIASDLHDDLGAKLLTIVHTNDIATIPDLAREALEEMRLAVRGMTGKPVNLSDALADWRAEIMGRLGQAQILGLWEDRSGGFVHVLPARVYMQLTRILREAVSNVIKHSEATRCKVRWDIVEGSLRMAVRDDGCGISDQLRRGQGMSSMKIRAKRMNGQCLVESRPGSGVEVSLTIPLQ